jgi:enoyl-CoA hydratase
MFPFSMENTEKSAAYTNVIVEKKERIGIVSINRPQAKNALNSAVVTELQTALNWAAKDPDVRVVVIKGEGGVFVAGADIKEMAGLSVSASYEIAERTRILHNQIAHLPKPVVASIEGYCLGGGLELALACDIRLCDPNAVFGLPEIKLGIIPGGGGTQRLFEIVGPSIASHLIFTGDFLSADRAYELKLVSRIEADVHTAAMLLAAQLADGSQNALAAAKRMINGRLQQHLQAGLQAEIHEFAMLFDHPDSLEGMSAFMEKRKPVFK